MIFDFEIFNTILDKLDKLVELQGMNRREEILTVETVISEFGFCRANASRLLHEAGASVIHRKFFIKRGQFEDYLCSQSGLTKSESEHKAKLHLNAIRRKSA